MSTDTIEQDDVAADACDQEDPFDLDITFIENGPQADALLIASTDDNCGSSCPNACTTSGN
jgi:FxLD family lantipeptide